MDNINEVEDDRKVVLAVDDEEAILDLLKFNIEKEGFKFISANNGEDAVIIAEEKKTRHYYIRCYATKNGWTYSL